MKKIILILAVSFVQMLAYAHPNDINNSQTIPLNSTLTVLEDINLLPNSDALYFNPQGPESIVNAYQRFSNGGVWCGLYFNSQTEDRVIRKGTTYKIINIDLHAGNNVFHSQMNSRTISSMQCRVMPYNELTIGSLRNALQKYFRLDIAPPIEVR